MNHNKNRYLRSSQNTMGMNPESILISSSTLPLLVNFPSFLSLLYSPLASTILRNRSHVPFLSLIHRMIQILRYRSMLVCIHNRGSSFLQLSLSLLQSITSGKEGTRVSSELLSCHKFVNGKSGSILSTLEFSDDVNRFRE